MHVLAIGNSFSEDAVRYLHRIARGDGVRLEVANLYIGGCSLERHFRNMQSGEAAYELQYNGENTGFSVSLKDALLNRPWDVVTLQQASPQSFRAESYTPYIESLAQYVRTLCPKARILVHQTWAYEAGSDRLLKYGFDDPAQMLAGVKAAYGEAAARIAAFGIIPAGEMFGQMLAAGVPRIHRDTYHVKYGIGRYALGLLWYRMLTGRCVADNTFAAFDEPIPEEEIRIAKACVDGFIPLLAN